MFPLSDVVFDLNLHKFLLVTGRGSIFRSEDPIWSTGSLTPLSGLTAFFVQLIYAWRVWMLGLTSKAIKLLVVVIVMLGYYVLHHVLHLRYHSSKHEHVINTILFITVHHSLTSLFFNFVKSRAHLTVFPPTNILLVLLSHQK